MKTFGRVWLGIGLLAIGFGIGILVLSFASGASWRDVPTYSVDESYDGIDAIDAQIDFAEVNIVEGNGFHIKGENLPDKSLEAYVSDGTWVIREDPDNIMDVFGLHFSMGQILWWKNDYQPVITITVPKDFAATDFSFEISAGSAEVENVNAVTGAFTVKAGRMKIDRIAVSDSSEFNVGTGDMIINQMKTNNINVDCGVGNVSMDGVVTGDNKINCGVGNIDMNLEGNVDDYSYEVESGIGRIKINDESYHNINDRRISSNGADNNLNLECGVGNITVVIE
jgi:hypothetical protein